MRVLTSLYGTTWTALLSATQLAAQLNYNKEICCVCVLFFLRPEGLLMLFPTEDFWKAKTALFASSDCDLAVQLPYEVCRSQWSVCAFHPCDFQFTPDLVSRILIYVLTAFLHYTFLKVEIFLSMQRTCFSLKPCLHLWIMLNYREPSIRSMVGLLLILMSPNANSFFTKMKCKKSTHVF